MTLATSLSLLGAMIALAIIPDASVIAVVARSMASGFLHGFIIVAGIITADILFIIVAVYSLSALAEMMGGMFVIVKYVGSAYLIWMGITLLRLNVHVSEVKQAEDASMVSSFLSGLFITFGDPKAILFYMSFLPAFIDLSKVTVFDVSIIVLLSALSVGGCKMGYAFMAGKARTVFSSVSAKRKMNIFAGIVLTGTGVYLIISG